MQSEPISPTRASSVPRNEGSEPSKRPSASTSAVYAREACPPPPPAPPPEDLGALPSRPFHRHEDEPEVRVLVEERDEEGLLPGARADEFALVGFYEGPVEPPLAQLDCRHLRRPDDGGRHRGPDPLVAPGGA